MAADHLGDTVTCTVTSAEKPKRQIAVAGQGGKYKRGVEAETSNGKHGRDDGIFRMDSKTESLSLSENAFRI
jgi:hypothetical protein